MRRALPAITAVAAVGCAVACAREVPPPVREPQRAPPPVGMFTNGTPDGGVPDDAEAAALARQDDGTTFGLFHADPIAVIPMDLAKYEKVTDGLAPARRHVLRGSLSDFRIVDASTKRTIASRQGWFAKWLSDSEVTFVSGGFISKLDVSAPNKVIRGGPACRPKESTDDRLPLCSDVPRLPLYVTRDLSHALVMSSLRAPKLLDITPSGVTTVFEESVGLAVSNDGATCALVRKDANNLELQFAVQPWTKPVLVRTLATELPVAKFAPEHLHFFSKDEVLVSLPVGQEDGEAVYRQCIVRIDGRTRCASTPRRAWLPVEDTARFVLEQGDPKKSPVLLVDVKRMRTHSLGVFGTRLASPLLDPGPPPRLLVARMDKTDVRYGAVALPLP